MFQTSRAARKSAFYQWWPPTGRRVQGFNCPCVPINHYGLRTEGLSYLTASVLRTADAVITFSACLLGPIRRACSAELQLLQAGKESAPVCRLGYLGHPSPLRGGASTCFVPSNQWYRRSLGQHVAQHVGSRRTARGGVPSRSAQAKPLCQRALGIRPSSGPSRTAQGPNRRAWHQTPRPTPA